MLKLLASLFLIITLGMAQGANAGPLEDGEAALSRGDYATALSLFRPLAAQGNAKAQFTLGYMYDNGEGVVQDHKEAVKWYQLAATLGDGTAQYNLGRMYRHGLGVTKNEALAKMWITRSAENPDVEEIMEQDRRKKRAFLVLFLGAKVGTNQFPCRLDQLHNLLVPCNRLCRIAPMLECISIRVMRQPLELSADCLWVPPLTPASPCVADCMTCLMVVPPTDLAKRLGADTNFVHCFVSAH